MSSAATQPNDAASPVFQVQDDALSSYGLNVNPFEASFDHSDIVNLDSSVMSGSDVIPFFMGGDRRAVLDEVIHLCQFSNNLVAVLGEAGVGKTALVYQSVIELSETSHCCLVHSSVMVSVNDVLRQLAQQLGIYVSEDMADIDTILDLLSQYQPSGAHQRVVVVVDDAHHLNADILAVLVGLLQQSSLCSFHVLLVGDSSLLPRLDQLDKGDILAYDIPLCPFTVDELGQYLSFKLAAVGYQGAELFDYDVVENIWRDTRGIPASVNQVAAGLLLNKALNKDDERRLGLPITYMALLVVLLAALIMAIFYVGDSPDSIDSSANDPLITSNEPLILPDSPPLTRSTTESLGENKVASVTSNEEAVPLIIEDQSSVVANAEATVTEDAEKVPNILAAESTPLPSESPVVEEVVVSASQEKVSVNDKESLLTEDIAKTEVIIANKAAANVTSNQSVDVPPSGNAPSDPKSPLLTTDEQAVMFWPEDAYTLQVMAAGQLAGVQAFVARQENRNLLRIVRSSRNGSPWYAVLVGIYDDIPLARQGISALPESQKTAKPWPRKIGEIQGKITEFRRR